MLDRRVPRRSCENYRVETDTGEYVGYVDRVVWSADGLEPKALLVDAAHDRTSAVVPLRCLVELNVMGELVVISSDALADRAVARCGSGRA